MLRQLNISTLLTTTTAMDTTMNAIVKRKAELAPSANQTLLENGMVRSIITSENRAEKVTVHIN